MNSFDAKVAMVTGAAGNLGRALAGAFASYAARCVTGAAVPLYGQC
jgi:NAD(P)-dependent dehydrogenase (short-subunit alcohol dehydrogenase family)